MAMDQHVLGDPALHQRFRVATEILGVLISIAPRAVSIAQLEIHTGRATRELKHACRNLLRAQLLAVDRQQRGSWNLACVPSQTTLKEVFLCVAEARPATVATEAIVDVGGIGHAVDLMLTQATMTVNQGVLAQLQRFSLDRLKVTSNFSQINSCHATRNSRYDVASDFGKIPCFT